MLKMDTIKNKKKNLVKLMYFLIPIFIFCGVFFVLWSLVSYYPFDHDESVYLTKARSWIEETPADEFEIYRPIGMPVFGWIFLHFGESEKIVRTFGVIFGSLTILLIYLFFKRLFNAYIAISVASVVGISSLFMQQAPHFLNDIPSSGFLIGVLYLLYIHYDTAGKSKSIYFAGPLAALAFYIRYGVASTLGILGILSFFILGPKFIKKEGINYSKLITAFIISIFLFIPHFIESIIVEKSLLGILSRAGKAAHRKYLGEGLVDYIKWLPSEIGGWVLGITAITGILITIIIIFRKDLRQDYINLLWIGSIGLFNFLATGLLAHAEPRYVFFPMVLLSGTGIAGLYYMAQNWSKIFVNLLTAIFLLSMIFYGINNYREINSFFRIKESDPHAFAYIKLSQVIRDYSVNKNGCVIWMQTSNRPRTSWYSKCNTFKISDVATFEKNFNMHLRESHYSVVRSKLKEGQIDQSEAEKFGIILTEIFRTENLSKFYGGDLIVYRITRKDSNEEDYLSLLENRSLSKETVIQEIKNEKNPIFTAISEKYSKIEETAKKELNEKEEEKAVEIIVSKDNQSKENKKNVQKETLNIVLTPKIESEIPKKEEIQEQNPAPSPILLPYNIKNFDNALSWKSLWGDFAIKNNLLHIISTASTTSGFTILKNSKEWTDYLFSIKADLVKGKSFSLVVRYKDPKNYVFCSFSDYGKSANIYQVLNGETKTLGRSGVLPAPYLTPWLNLNFGVKVSGDNIECLINGSWVLRNKIETMPKFGGIGFKIWGNKSYNNEVMIKEINAEKIY